MIKNNEFISRQAKLDNTGTKVMIEFPQKMQEISAIAIVNRIQDWQCF